MKLRYETRIGLLAAICIAGLIWGYNFLKGRNLLTSARTFTAVYANVDLLSESSPVLLNGLQVGVVVDMFYANPEQMDSITVVMSVDREFLIPTTAIAVIIDQGFMGGKAIELRLGTPCSPKLPCPTVKGQLRGQIQGFLTSVVGSPEEVDVYLEHLTTNIRPLIDSLEMRLKGDAESEGINRTLYELAQTAQNLNALTSQLNSMVTTSSASFTSIAKNLDAITHNVKENEATITRLLENTANLTENLQALPLDSTFEATNTMISELELAIRDSRGLFSSLGEMLDTINSGSGSIGKLLTSDDFYQDLSSMTRSVDSLTTDLQHRPYRYFPLKSRSGIKRKDRKDAASKNR